MARHVKDYYLVKRRDALTSGKPTYYVRFRGQDGKLLPWRSSGETTKTAAETWAIAEIKGGRVNTQHALTFSKYAIDWWTDSHPYVQGRLARGKRLTATYLVVMHGHLENHLLPTFGPKRVTQIAPRDVEDWLLKMRRDSKLSAISINHALRCLKIMLREALRQGIIAADPSAFITGLAEHPKERGILSPVEMHKLFNLRTVGKVWGGDRKHFTLNVLAASTGCRMGELQALTVGSVFPDYISVTRAWERRSGLRESTKTGRGRLVPVPSKVRSHLGALMQESPFREPGDLVFHNGVDRRTPVHHRDILRVFYQALERIEVTPEQRMSRRLTFHSYRHGLATMLRLARVPDHEVKAVTGHATQEMLEHYTAHLRVEDFGAVRKVQEALL